MDIDNVHLVIATHRSRKRSGYGVRDRVGNVMKLPVVENPRPVSPVAESEKISRLRPAGQSVVAMFESVDAV